MLVIMKKLLLLATLVGAVLSVQADVLFYTDFHTTPPGFKAASDKATLAGVDDTILVNPAGATVPKDTIIDGCTISAAKSSTTTNVVLISKGSQTCVPVGDVTGCTAGRISLKNTGSSITMPKVLGPCSITYYAAASSATAGRGVNCSINNVLNMDASISELLVNLAQATVKKVYNYTGTDSVAFTLAALGGIYIYDINIQSGAASEIVTKSAAKNIQTIQKVGTIIKNGKNARIDIFTLGGTKIMSSNKSIIDVAGLTHGVYMARITGTNGQIKIVR
jgi:hypothetical protein